MKTMWRYCVMIAGLVLAGWMSVPGMAEAAILNVNGENLTIESSGKVLMQDGTTWVSEAFLQDEMFLTLAKEDERFTLTNAYEDFTLEGAVGSKVLRLNGDEKQMAAAAKSIDGTLYVPLRPLMEWFGEIAWDGSKQAIFARFDYNDQLNLPQAQLAEEPMRYDIPMNSGIVPDENDVPIYETSKGLMIEQRTNEDHLAAVRLGSKVLIAPQHEGNVLDSGSYAVEDDYLYWIEKPDPAIVMAGDPQWYLYIQERRDGAEPVCVDSGSYKALPSDYVLGNCSFKNGNIIWLRGDKDSDQIEARLYQHDTGKTTVLDSISVTSRETLEVELGDEDAFWTRSRLMEGMRQYGTLKRLHLSDGSVDNLSQGYNLLSPHVIGDHLIVRTKPEGNNFMPDLDHPGNVISTELWVYDLEKEAWSFKVDNHLALIGEKRVISMPIALDASHMTVGVNDGSGYHMPIVDLETGMVYDTANEENESLLFMQYGMVGEGQTAIRTIQPVFDMGSCMAAQQTMTNGVLSEIYVPIRFEWSTSSE